MNESGSGLLVRSCVSSTYFIPLNVLKSCLNAIFNVIYTIYTGLISTSTVVKVIGKHAPHVGTQPSASVVGRDLCLKRWLLEARDADIHV